MAFARAAGHRQTHSDATQPLRANQIDVRGQLGDAMDAEDLWATGGTADRSRHGRDGRRARVELDALQRRRGTAGGQGEHVTARARPRGAGSEARAGDGQHVEEQRAQRRVARQAVQEGANVGQTIEVA